MIRERTADVLVVGAGPTGLMLANVLTRLGVPTILIDAKCGPTRESRALGIQARTMEIYDQLGVIDRVLAECTVGQTLAPGYGGKTLGRIRLGALGAGVTPYPHLYVLEQSRNERLLVDNLTALGGEVRWAHRLTALEVAEPGQVGLPVTATVTATAIEGGAEGEGEGEGGSGGGAERPAGDVAIRARYCVGADGGSSAVRKARGIRFEGITNAHTFYVLDAAGTRGLAPDAVNIRPGPTDFLLTFPMGAGGRARLLGTVRDADAAGHRIARTRPDPDDPAAPALTEEVVRERLRRFFSVTYGSALWFSTYRVHHRIAATFRDGPVFLAGDAAHVHSPVGAQGMNTGLQDAHNLACKLADVVQGRAPDRYLDRYEAERRPVARRLVSTTDRLFRIVTSDRRVARALRRLAVSLVAPIATAVVPRVGAASRLFEYLSQTRIHYWLSDQAKLEAGGRRGRVVGRRLPYSGDNFAPLRSLTWQVHAYGSVRPQVVARLRAALGLEVHVLPEPANPRLRAGRIYLVRPDGFVVAEATPGTAVEMFVAVLHGTAVGP